MSESAKPTKSTPYSRIFGAEKAPKTDYPATNWRHLREYVGVLFTITGARWGDCQYGECVRVDFAQGQDDIGTVTILKNSPAGRQLADNEVPFGQIITVYRMQAKEGNTYYVFGSLADPETPA